jgi:hypothetical protein
VSLGIQIVLLLVLSVPAASVSWTVTHEAIFQEIREFCKARSQHGRNLVTRKFFYLFTCEYCFSHYVAAVLLVITRFKLVFPDWRGYVISLFSLVWISNHYISIYNRLRLNIKHEHISITAQQKQVESRDRR